MRAALDTAEYREYIRQSQEGFDASLHEFARQLWRDAAAHVSESPGTFSPPRKQPDDHLTLAVAFGGGRDRERERERAISAPPPIRHTLSMIFQNFAIKREAHLITCV